MNRTSQEAIQLLRSYLSGKSYVASLSKEEWTALLDFLQQHRLDHLVKQVASNLPPELEERTDNAFYSAILQDERSKYTLRQMAALFGEMGIDFMPLKGAVLCWYYPETWHRTRGDLDILIHKEDLETVTAALTEKLGFRMGKSSEHDISFRAPNRIFVELHYELHEKWVSAEEVWASAHSDPEVPQQYLASSEMFVLHHFAHMAKHILYGGCGIRFFLDLWFIYQKMDFDRTVFACLLEERGLKQFADRILALEKVWFQGEPHNAFTSRLSDYILAAGIYGNLQNVGTSGMIQEGGRFRYILRRIFQPYEILRYGYPILEKRRWLLPFCQVCRWIRLLRTQKLASARKEFSIKNTTQDETIYLFDNLGLLQNNQGGKQ